MKRGSLVGPDSKGAAGSANDVGSAVDVFVDGDNDADDDAKTCAAPTRYTFREAAATRLGAVGNILFCFVLFFRGDESASHVFFFFLFFFVAHLRERERDLCGGEG